MIGLREYFISERNNPCGVNLVNNSQVAYLIVNPI